MRSISFGIAIAAIAFISACNSNPTAPSATPTAVLGGSLAFGSVPSGTTATATFTISQTGTSPLTVTSITYPAGFTGNWTGGTIAGSATQSVIVTFAPTTSATYGGAVTVTTSQSSSSITASGTGGSAPTFKLSGLVTESAPTTSTVLAGATITFVDGANQGKSAVSGPDGRYEISGLSNGGYTLSVTLAGYVGAAVPVGIDGNSTLNLRLNPVAPRTSFGPGQVPCKPRHAGGTLLQRPG